MLLECYYLEWLYLLLTYIHVYKLLKQNKLSIGKTKCNEKLLTNNKYCNMF